MTARFFVFVWFCGLFVSISCQPTPCGTKDFGIVYDGSTVFSVSYSNSTCACSGGFYSPAASILDGGIGRAGGTTNVYSALLANQALTVTGTFTANGPSIFNNNVNVASGTLTVGASVAASFAGSLTASGTTTFTGPVTFSNSVTVAGGQTVNIATTGSAGVVNVGSASVATPLNVWGAAGLRGAATLSSTLTVSGISTFNAGVVVARGAGSSATADVGVSAGSQSLRFFANVAAGVNGLAAAGDSALIYGSTNFVVGPQTASAFGVRMTSAGSVGINIDPSAAPAAALHVNGQIRTEAGLQSVGLRVQRDIFQWSTSAGGGCQQVHLKTNLQMSVTYCMFRFLIEGYAYGAAAIINSECCGYLYPPNMPNALLNTQCVDRGSGITTSMYRSSDNYLVIQVNMANSYFTGFSVSVWQTNPTGPSIVTMAAYPQCTAL